MNRRFSYMKKSLYIIMVCALSVWGLGACTSEMDIESVIKENASTKADDEGYQNPVEVTLEEPGTLAEALGDKANAVDKLTVSGPLDGDDMKTIVALPKLIAIDMTNTRIIGGKPYRDNDNALLKNDTIARNIFGGPSSRMDNLNEIILPNTLKAIDEQAFHYSNISVIKMYEGLEWIGRYAFASCKMLKELIIPQSVNKMEVATFEYCDQLEKVVFSDFVKVIPDGCLLQCGMLKDVQLPKDLESIGKTAFYACHSLETIELPDKLTSIGEYTFEECESLNNVIIPLSLTKIPAGCFKDCNSLKKIILHDQIEEISDHAFQNSGLETLDVPPLVTTIEEGTFDNCALKEIDLNNVETIGYRAFINCSDLKSIAIPETVKELGADVFWGNGLTELVVPENVVMVGDRICYGCSSLRYATINSKVMSMGEGLFENCANLNAVFWNTSATFKHDENPFNLNCLIYINNEKAAVVGPNLENIIINGHADKLILTSDGGDFFVPQPFTASKVTYTRTFDFPTYVGEAAGWESISLPFAVQAVEHEDGRVLAPFNSDVDGAKPFWLRRLTMNGFENVTEIEANVPYIIAMPNNGQYADEYNVAGKVTFTGQDVDFPVTDLVSLPQDEGPEYLFHCNYGYLPMSASVYVLNENSDNGHAGSAFVRNSRDARPFEGYVTNKGGASPAMYSLGGGVTRGLRALDSVPSVDDM